MKNKTRHSNGKKGSLFFTVDVLLSLVVIVTTFLVIGTGQSQDFDIESSQDVADEVDNFFSETTIENIRNNYAFIYQPYEFDPTTQAWRLDFTINEEVGYLLANNHSGVANGLVRNVSELVLPQQYSFEYSVDDATVYSRTRKPSTEAVALAVNKRIVYIKPGNTDRLVGPNVSEVQVWN